MNLITKEIFINCINRIKTQHEYDLEMANITSKLYPNAFTANLLYNNHLLYKVLLDTLKHLMNDNSNWIDYYCFDLDFGKNNNKLKVTINNIVVPLTTVEDLWNILTK